MRDVLFTDTVLLPDAPAAMEIAAPITPEQSLSFVARTTRTLGRTLATVVDPSTL